MLPRLWSLDGSDRPRYRQCQFLSCPGQLKKWKFLQKRTFLVHRGKGEQKKGKGKHWGRKKKESGRLRVTFNKKKVLPKQFSIATLPLPSLFLSKVFNTDKLTNSSEKVQVKIVEVENIMSKRRKRRDALGWRMILDSDGEGDFLGYARFQGTQSWTGKGKPI